MNRVAMKRMMTSRSGWFCLCFGWLASTCPLPVWSQPPTEAASQTSTTPADDIRQWIEDLNAPSYSTRQLAFWKLLRQGESAVPVIEASLPKADADAAQSLIRLLNELAIDPNTGPGPAALSALRRTAQSSITLHGMLARRSLDSLATQQRTVVQEELTQLGAFIGFRDLQVLTQPRQQAFHVAIGENFLGTEQDLDRLQWMVGIEILVLEGPKVTGTWLRRAAQMPDLKVLQIRRADLSNDDLANLAGMQRLDTLELIYVPIGDDGLKHIEGLPLGSALRLFGTRVTASRFESLRESMSEMDSLIFGRGGYLGVSIDSQDGVTIRTLPEGSAAARAGLMIGDRVVQINERKLSKFEDLRSELSGFAAGEDVHVIYERSVLDPSGNNGRTVMKLETTVTLGEQP